MKFNEKLKMLREEKGMSVTDFAKFLGTSKQVISRYELGENTPKITTVMSYAKKLNVSLEFLMNDDINKYDESSIASNIFHYKTKKVPLLGDIACGVPIYADEQHGEFVDVSSDIKVDFCLRAKGDSMINARINDGDIVFIHKQDIVDNGKIAAVIINDEATLKRVYYYPDESKLILTPENHAYAPLVYVGDELNNIKIIGMAVAFQSIL